MDRETAIELATTEIKSKFSLAASQIFNYICSRTDRNGYFRISKKGIQHLVKSCGAKPEDVGALFEKQLQPIYTYDGKLTAVVATCLQKNPT